MSFALVDKAENPRLLYLATRDTLEGLLETLGADVRAWADSQGFTADPGSQLGLPDNGGVIVGMGDDSSPLGGADAEFWALGALPDSLPLGSYVLAHQPAEPTASRLALGWALGAYAFTRYKKRKRAPASLVWPEQANRERVTAMAEAVYLGRDLINTPAGDLGPKELAATARDVAEQHRASCSVITGDDLLIENYPAVHAVGRAATNGPRLIDLRWGDENHPKITLVGKGVCFDSGGLDIKPAGGMQLMKKDMGGAASVLALAHALMRAKLPIRLRVLIPAVENAISGNAFHPLDVLATRKGLTVEVGNTDAEGRLILCDALAEADREKPALLIDCATLTGAARVALGPDLPVIFTRHDALADDLQNKAAQQADPVWRLPLWPGYRRLLDSKVADLSSTGESSFNGAITAALFLAEFVDPSTKWVHIDMIAWNTRSRPGRPEGGEVQTIRALFALIEDYVTA
ncbi:leucyl aminopeptidase [Elstera cyanobacteriorum]|uniref:Leucyl aminopeptidase n=1 Tax=Elstera cyanobacteriorum TaxID=2022747 RepID=A0A255XJW1_9PROT|nr:leucyl aminopeptidase family protein [Elstera cyanobacteriorum]OYQ17259.1 leucyl aminopeptidase [Elstera cyanobacteriorum]GFZ92617.1 leucyl aminopeptidase [Elstera cyanobacteriorum]